MPGVPVRYRSADEDSARWAGFPFREGDIVISTRSRSGTTWMQMICALLVFQTPALLVHYDDLSADLDGEMRRLAGLLGITVPGGAWPALVAAATFDRMRARAGRLVPAPPGILIDSAAFFRRGTSGSWRELLTGGERARYHTCAAQMAPPGLLDWLHREATPAGGADR